MVIAPYSDGVEFSGQYLTQHIVVRVMGPLLADFTMPLLVFERQLNDSFQTFIFIGCLALLSQQSNASPIFND